MSRCQPSVAAAVSIAVPAVAIMAIAAEDAATIAGTAGFAKDRDQQRDACENADENPFHDTPLMPAAPRPFRGMVL